MKTRIIVDSTADLVPEIKARVSTVPLTVHFGQEEYIDGVTIDNRTFMKSSSKAMCCPPPVRQRRTPFIKEFEKVRQAEEAAVVSTLSSKFSGTYQSAIIAGGDYGKHLYCGWHQRSDGNRDSGGACVPPFGCRNDRRGKPGQVLEEEKKKSLLWRWWIPPNTSRGGRISKYSRIRRRGNEYQACASRY